MKTEKISSLHRPGSSERLLTVHATFHGLLSTWRHSEKLFQHGTFVSFAGSGFRLILLAFFLTSECIGSCCCAVGGRRAGSGRGLLHCDCLFERILTVSGLD